jgi:hypothetical protein
MRRTAVAIIAAIGAIAATAPAASALVLASPGGSVTASGTGIVIDRYQLTDTGYPEWRKRESRTCDFALAGTVDTGSVATSTSASISFTSGTASNCSSPVTLEFAAGPWRYMAWGLFATMGFFEGQQMTLDVNGTTCTYNWYTYRELKQGGTVTPVTIGTDDFTELELTGFNGPDSGMASSTSRACGAIRLRDGSRLLISPQQTFTRVP